MISFDLCDQNKWIVPPSSVVLVCVRAMFEINDEQNFGLTARGTLGGCWCSSDQDEGPRVCRRPGRDPSWKWNCKRELNLISSFVLLGLHSDLADLLLQIWQWLLISSIILVKNAPTRQEEGHWSVTAGGNAQLRALMLLQLTGSSTYR